MSNQMNTDKVENVAARFRRRKDEAVRLGFDVRLVTLDDQLPGWCLLAGKCVAFLDVTATTTEQLVQLDDILTEYQARRAA
ncbi:MAG: hypothetical protein AAFU85_09525 [Planctomycetota bacterium]